jgi:hypothetical protein
MLASGVTTGKAAIAQVPLTFLAAPVPLAEGSDQLVAMVTTGRSEVIAADGCTSSASPMG